MTLCVGAVVIRIPQVGQFLNSTDTLLTVLEAQKSHIKRPKILLLASSSYVRREVKGIGADLIAGL